MEIGTGRLAQTRQGFDGELELLAESARKVLADLCTSRNLHAFADGNNPLDFRLGKLAAELGWHLVGVPEDLGGLGLGLPGIVTLGRELGATLAPGGVIETTAGLAWLASRDGSERIVNKLIDGIGSAASTIAVPVFPDEERSEDGVLSLQSDHLSGQSMPMLLGANAGYAILPVGYGEACSLAIVALDDPGIAITPKKLWDRTRVISRIALDGVRPLHVVEDPDGQATSFLECILSLVVSADSLGGARSALDLAVAYCTERFQFGRSVASNQGLKHRAATADVKIGEAEDLLDYGVECLASGRFGAAAWVAVLKAQACDAYRLAAEEDVLFHGGVGFTSEFDCHLYLKRAALNIYLAGGARANRDRAAALFVQASRSGVSIAEIA